MSTFSSKQRHKGSATKDEIHVVYGEALFSEDPQGSENIPAYSILVLETPCKEEINVHILNPLALPLNYFSGTTSRDLPRPHVMAPPP